VIYLHYDPESVVSRECRNELATATQYHKLIIPVVLKDVDRQGLPDSLSKPNWIVFGPDCDARCVFGEVIAAQEWAGSPRDRSLLLRGRDLLKAEEWQGQGADPDHKATPPTPLQIDYIRASRKAARRRRALTGSAA